MNDQFLSKKNHFRKNINSHLKYKANRIVCICTVTLHRHHNYDVFEIL